MGVERDLEPRFQKLLHFPASEEPYGKQRRLRKILGKNPSTVIVPTETSKLPDSVSPFSQLSRLVNALRNASLRKSRKPPQKLF